MRKKKILFVINQFFKGGAETALLNLLLSLDKEQYDVDLLVYDQIKLEGVVSLLPQIPEWINVCDAAGKENRIAFVKKAYHRVVRDLTKAQLYRLPCYEFVKEKRYDVAISYGEWFSPEFVATRVNAERKIVWIHSDIDKAQFFSGELMFKYDDAIHLYLFVSQRSMEGALKYYPQLHGRTAVVHNMCDDEAIRQAGKEPYQWNEKWKRPILLTVANFRAEKNHLRQLEAMRLLKKRGFDFTWVNIGSDTDTVLIGKIDAQIKKYGLEGRFIRMPAQKSPYPYMRAADAVAVLSDFESWSLVITEAKLLGVPVVATRTSGALEQIEDGVTGVLCDFSPKNIADKIECLLSDKALQARISTHLKGFTTRQTVLEEFDRAIEQCGCGVRKKLLYISDNINYVSGVQKVTATQARALSKNLNISIFSMEPANEESKKLFAGIPIYDMQEYGRVTCLTIPAKEVLLGRRFTLRQKVVRTFYAVARRFGKGDWAIMKLTGRKLQRLFEKFDTVCVLSEASQMRECVAKLTHPRKVQWIHTDYALWSQYTDWTRRITSKDGELYQAYDAIVCLTETSRQGFIKMYPHLSEKTCVIPNMQPVAQIKEKANAVLPVKNFDPKAFNIVTIGRMDTEKAVDRILNVCKRLKNEGFVFHWYLVGNGSKREEWENCSVREGLNDYVHFLGALDNPYSLLKNASLFALLSRYEGLPVTIEEAKILHIPVIATKVGGIVEQIKDGETGILVENEEESIYAGLKSTLSHLDSLQKCRIALKEYEFDNDEILDQLKMIFAGKA